MNRVSLLLFACAVPAAASAQDPRQIMSEVQKRATAQSQRYEGSLKVIDANSKVADKKWVYERLGSHGNSRTVIRFTGPAEVKGVALLIQNHPDRASDQWMWTPAIERDRRIALQDRSTRFFGTDFTFEDLEEREVNQYDYTLVGDEAEGGVLCWKIEGRPKRTRTSQYTRSIIWIRKDNYAYARVDLYVGNEVVRRLNYNKIVSIQNIWTAREMTMTDLKRGTLTRLALENVEYNIPLKESDFTLQALRR